MAFVLYLFGIGVHSFFPWERVPFFVWFVLILVGCAAFAFSSERRVARAAVMGILAFFVGAWCFDLTIPSPRDGLMPWIQGRISAEGRVQSVHPFGPGVSLSVSVDRVSRLEIHGPGNILRVGYFGRFVPRVGSRVLVACEIQGLRDTYLAKQGIWVECHGTSIVTVRSPPSRWDVRSMLTAWREFLTTRIVRLFPHDEGTLLTGMLYGDQDLTSAQRETLRRAGLTHLVAVSGSNVTIVTTVLLSLVLAMGFRRRHAFWVVTIGILAFLGFVGFSASVMRAGLMGWLVLFARHVGRTPLASRLLLLSAVALVTFNPWILGFDAGFALSFLATWGLMSWTPLLAERIQWIPEKFGLREMFAMTSGATLMTLPYLAWAFHRMSLAGLLTNMFAIPLVPFIMLWGAVAAVIGPFFSGATLPAFGLVWLLEKIASVADAVPILDLHVEAMEFPFLVLSYAALWWIWRRLSGKRHLSTSGGLF